MWIIWFGGPTDFETSKCAAKLTAEAQTIRQSLSTSADFQSLGIEIPQALDIETQTRPATCFNGVKDEGEINTDCGNDACDLKCLEHLTCTRAEDCVQECFASICQFVSAGSYANAVMVLILGLVMSVVGVQW